MDLLAKLTVLMVCDTKTVSLIEFDNVMPRRIRFQHDALKP